MITRKNKISLGIFSFGSVFLLSLIFSTRESYAENTCSKIIRFFRGPSIAEIAVKTGKPISDIKLKIYESRSVAQTLYATGALAAGFYFLGIRPMRSFGIHSPIFLHFSNFATGLFYSAGMTQWLEFDYFSLAKTRRLQRALAVGGGIYMNFAFEYFTQHNGQIDWPDVLWGSGAAVGVGLADFIHERNLRFKLIRDGVANPPG